VKLALCGKTNRQRSEECKMNTIKELRTKYKLTQKQLSQITEIPLRTIENWEGGQRKCPPYVEKLLTFYLENSIKKEG
jgi:DNA-binding transcriptional regulator YiaG